MITCREVSKAFAFRTNRARLLKDRVLAALRPQLRATPEMFWALRDVSLQVEAGESFGLIGPNGAGKSTLLRIVSGIFQPTRGTVVVRGRLAPLLGLGVGFHPELTGRENIYLNAALFGLTTKEIRRLEEAIIEFSELRQFVDAPTKNYSAGMQVRLGFAIATAVEPDSFLVDEVLAVGDAHFRSKCMRRLAEHRAAGRTFVVATHDLRFVEESCDRAALLVGGHMAAVGPAKEVVQRYRADLLGPADLAPTMSDEF